VTTEITKTISTGGKPDYVGANEDIFVGNVTNIVYGKALDLMPIPATSCVDCSEREYNGYKLGVKGIPEVKSRIFNVVHFTQSYIQNTLIPNLQSVRNTFLITIDISDFKPGVYINNGWRTLTQKLLVK
jgi:hypothetical protein